MNNMGRRSPARKHVHVTHTPLKIWRGQDAPVNAYPRNFLQLHRMMLIVCRGYLRNGGQNRPLIRHFT